VQIHDPEAWHKIEKIFLEAAGLSGDERASFLDAACAGDASLRAEVDALLAADEAGDLTLTAVVRGSMAAVALREDTLEGQYAGAWRLVEEIGRGGMGTVYRAVREDGEFTIEAAVKILTRGVSSRLLLDRFRRERQILSRMEHPNIARLFDGGATSGGLPYLVMEYVQGVPLTRYCDERRLSIRDRVALFRKVCDAVSGAHRNLVIHRDLKPDNILVTADGVPKLLDFGIAKLLETGAGTGESGELTMTAERIGTPAWSSPEQVSGEPVGVATDIYSLGVVLYRLLTGYRPYHADSVTWENAMHVVCEREPMRASDAVSSKPKSAEVAADLASARNTTPEALRRLLSGDLDNILLFALRKEPDRRYRTVDQFSDELRRYLDGRAVMAGGDTMIYLAGKFVRRHKLGVGMAGLLTLLLCVSTVAAIWQARRLSVRIVEDRKLATTFLVDINDDISRLPGSLPAREAMLRKSLDYLNGLAHDAGEDRETRRSLALAEERFASLLLATGKSDEARRAWDVALKIREALRAETPADLTAQYELGNTVLTGTAITSRSGSVEEMHALDRKALGIAESLVAADSGRADFQLLLARSYASLASTLNIAGKPDEATGWLRKAVPIREKLSQDPKDTGAQHELAALRYRLGVIEAQSDRFEAALADLTETVRIQTALLAAPTNSPQFAL